MKDQDSSPEAGEKIVHYDALWDETWSGEAEGLEGLAVRRAARAIGRQGHRVSALERCLLLGEGDACS